MEENHIFCGKVDINLKTKYGKKLSILGVLKEKLDFLRKNVIMYARWHSEGWL